MAGIKPKVSATEFCCTGLAPVFGLACRMPCPPKELARLTLLPTLASVGVWVMVLAVRLAVLNDDPAPPVTFVVESVGVIVVELVDVVAPDETLEAPAVTLSS